MKPRLYIAKLPGRDGFGRSMNLWCGVNLYPGAFLSRRRVFHLGMVAVFPVEDALRAYFKKLERARRRLVRSERLALVDRIAGTCEDL